MKDVVKLLLDQAVRNESGQVLLRSKLRAVSRRMGFTQIARERMELVFNEMVSNQVKFANGSGLVQMWEVKTPRPALDLFAMDYGPGIANLPEALEDGHSTANTLGKGLGVIRRLAHEHELYSLVAGSATDAPWHGMAVWARFYCRDAAHPPTYEFGSYLRAYQDSVYNGDSLGVSTEKNKIRWLHMDGLGHGRRAFEVVNGAGDLLNDQDAPLPVLLEKLTTQLQGTRGAVGIVCEVDIAEGSATVTGVGDMSAYLILNGERRGIAFSAGILGHVHRSIDTHSLPYPRQALLITASDGLRRNWTLNTFPGLWRLHPQMIALILGQVVSRGNDDRSLFVIRTTPERGKNHGKKSNFC